ncbi:hypothetical protein NC651_027836 [Populus alba x Populus x berolinensis]|nr:hypothetical protein NC651_027836 [Populus alba x Populus x berolinensis]
MEAGIHGAKIDDTNETAVCSHGMDREFSFCDPGEDVLPERINKKGTLNVDLLSPEKGSLRKSVAETLEETETTDTDPINATLH